ncbi:TIGR03943 family protein [Paenibacillus sp. LMG 31456]|uniref:TIGR03943 family protein n=1 Tax=Paenibacillus foliorum TaxID=2654974 RepID=A0A972GZJ3_9BACL|nr:TIGR03943 family protein [Paenibacillus foliorum]NOU95775.1 TIGR03943 family protein [Paenibacillus foliorum]
MSPRIYSLHHFIKATILFGFAMYIVHLVKTDNILFYIAPRMVDYVKWSAVAFYAIAVYQVYQAIRAFFGSAAACDCDHDHTPSSSLLKNTVIYGLFFFPLLLGFLLPDTSMGSSLAAKKGMNLSSSSNVKKDASTPAPNPSSPSSGATGSGNGSAAVPGAPLTPGDSAGKAAASSTGNQDAMFPSDKFTEHYAKLAKELYKAATIPVKEDMYIETLTTVDLYLDQFVGKKLELTGFVYRQEDMKDNQFVVGRFSIQCCSADASPFGVLVEYDRAKNFADDSWVTVTGTIQKAKFNDIDVIMLKVEKVAKAEPAKTQYVYPNIDFGS